MAIKKSDTPEGVNTKLLNVAIVLVIVCAVGFILFWILPSASQKVEETTTNVEQTVEEVQTSITQAELDARPEAKFIDNAMHHPTIQAALQNSNWRLKNVRTEQRFPNVPSYNVYITFATESGEKGYIVVANEHGFGNDIKTF